MYVSRGGLKLDAALQAFAFDPAGLTCADLGCSTGGFTDCLLQHGAAHVYSADTGYGVLAWKLRQDPRVTVLERRNALHLDPHEAVEDFPGCSLVVIDLGWTPQRLAIPAARRWLRTDQPGHIITLIKPHYEASALAAGQRPADGREEASAGRCPAASGRKANSHKRPKAILDDAEAAAVHQRVLGELPALGVEVLGDIISPIRGGKGGNVEYLALLRVRSEGVKG